MKTRAKEGFDELMNTQYYKDMLNDKFLTDRSDMDNLEETVVMLKPRQHTKDLFEMFSARILYGFKLFLKGLPEHI